MADSASTSPTRSPRYAPPAAAQASDYTSPRPREPLLFGKSGIIGGSLTTTVEVRNFPGCPRGVHAPGVWTTAGPGRAVRRTVAAARVRHRAQWSGAHGSDMVGRGGAHTAG
ncbi:hypothetical protein E6R62_16645 [Streptomyces sp. A1136]|nr:hypothetical protein E6R62_16645 [Streptomyces sp. A1136]